SARKLDVLYPYDGRLSGTVTLAGGKEVEAAITAALARRGRLSRFERYQILDKARQLLEDRKEEFATLITSESGLCIREALYETGRARDVLAFASMEALR